MSSYKIKLRGETPGEAYLDGTRRPKKKRSQVVDPGRWDEYLRRMLTDMKAREKKLAAIWSDIAKKEAEKARQQGHRPVEGMFRRPKHAFSLARNGSM